MSCVTAGAFEDGSDDLVIASRRAIHDGAAIVMVENQGGDSGWVFYAQGSDEDGYGMVHPSHLIHQDPTLLEVADLPPNFAARRKGAGLPWARFPRPPESDDD